MDDMIPSSQPVSSTVEEIQTMKKTLDRQTKLLANLKKTDGEYNQCFQNIKVNLLQMEEIELTVGDLRLTKIGKFMTKLERNLPAELAAIAVGVNKHWKNILCAYREEFKRKISNENQKISKANTERKADNILGNSDVLAGLSAVQLLTQFRQTSSSKSADVLDKVHRNSITESRQQPQDLFQPQEQQLQQNNVDTNLHSVEQSDDLCEQMNNGHFSTNLTNGNIHQQHNQKKQQQKQHGQQSQEQQQHQEQKHGQQYQQQQQHHQQQRHRQQKHGQQYQQQQQRQQQKHQLQQQNQLQQQHHQQNQHHYQQQQQQNSVDQQIQNQNLQQKQQQTLQNQQQKESHQQQNQSINSTPISSQKIVVSSFAQIFRRSLDNTTQRVHSMQKECLNILESMDQMKSDLEEFQNNVNQLLFSESGNLSSTLTNGGLAIPENPYARQPIEHSNHTGGTNNQDFNETLNNEPSSNLHSTSVTSHNVDNIRALSSGESSNTICQQPIENMQRCNSFSEQSSHSVNKIQISSEPSVHLGNKELPAVVRNVFLDINIKRKRYNSNDSDSDSTVAKKQQHQKQQQQQQEQQQQQKQQQQQHHQQQKQNTLVDLQHFSSTLIKNTADDGEIAINIKKEPRDDVPFHSNTMKSSQSVTNSCLSKQQSQLQVHHRHSQQQHERSLQQQQQKQHYRLDNPQCQQHHKQLDEKEHKQQPQEKQQQQQQEWQNKEPGEPAANFIHKTKDNLRFVSSLMGRTSCLTSGALDDEVLGDSTSTDELEEDDPMDESSNCGINNNLRRSDTLNSESLQKAYAASNQQQQQQQQQGYSQVLKKSHMRFMSSSLQPSSPSLEANFDSEGFEIPTTLLSQSVVKTGSSTEVIVRDSNNTTNDVSSASSSDQEFFTFSQQVDDLESDEVDSDERKILLQNSAKYRRSWNEICKTSSGLKYASLVKSKGRMKAAHRSSVAKQGMNRFLDNFRKTGKLHTSFFLTRGEDSEKM